MTTSLMALTARPLLLELQCRPPSVDLKRPTSVLVLRRVVAAYSVEGVFGSTATETTSGYVNPVFAEAHVRPLLVLLKTPPLVPAYTVKAFDGSTVTSLTRMTFTAVLMLL